jgi:para-nitrobenzyl esterase
MVAGGNANVWTYRFDWDDEGSFLLTDLSEMLGAAHSMEIPFVFGHFRLLGTFDRFAFTKDNAPGRFALSELMMGYWARFAAGGDPGGAPAWTRYGASVDTPSAMVFDAPHSGGARMIGDRETQPRLITDRFADPSLKTDARRCVVFKSMATWNPEMVGMDRGRCR